MIRVVTTGYFVRPIANAPGKKELIFRKPEGDFKSEKAAAAAAAHERFIAYLPQKGCRFDYGDAVKFDLRSFERWEEFVKRKKVDKYAERMKELKTKIPSQWQEKMGEEEWDKWQFKYVATDVVKLRRKFILAPFYRFIGDLEKNGVEDVLQLLSMLDKYNLEEPLRINLKGEPNCKVDAVRVWDAAKFDAEVDGAEIVDASDSKRIDAQIAREGRHPMATKKEVPTREGRWAQ
ncbi:MAG: hypothetical protein R3301_11220 [Saprospiraceae bacterium]|nr:hypothetical protein [Saprospiraceae bacterium]